MRQQMVMSSLTLIAMLASASAHANEATATAKDAKELAARIDQHIEASWRAHKVPVKPGDPADDATYLRRVYLDIVGQVPSVTEARDFIDDPAADKKQRLVDRLLATDAHARHFATILRKALLPGGVPLGTDSDGLEVWFQQQIHENIGYDEVARSLLTGDPTKMPYVVFAAANEQKPENLATATSRFFMGVRLECAQCHNHPFATWKKEQFWEFVAYFSGGQATIPNTDKVVTAQLFVGAPKEIKEKQDLRQVLAEQITSADNPFFARAVVNRIWLQFFGVGLVDPVDALGEDSPPSHPELLDELAREFAARKYDLRFLIRAITSTKTYALSSEATDASQDDPRLFARAAIRGLSAQQIYDSLAVVTGKTAPLGRGTVKTIAQNAFGPRGEFITRFSSPGTPLEGDVSVLQALELMNGNAMAGATNLEKNPRLRRIVEQENQSTARRIEELYLMTLSRLPRAEEMERLVKFVESGTGRANSAKAMADVFWALLNSPEFRLNH